MGDNKYYSKYFVYKSQNNNAIESSKVEDNLRQLLKSSKKPIACNICNGKLDYKGLGHYICTKCGNNEYDNYGKIRNLLDINTTMSIGEVIEKTGLTREDIKDLLDEGSIQLCGRGLKLV